VRASRDAPASALHACAQRSASATQTCNPRAGHGSRRHARDSWGPRAELPYPVARFRARLTRCCRITARRSSQATGGAAPARSWMEPSSTRPTGCCRSSNALWRASRNRVSTVPCATAPRAGMRGTVPSCPQRRRTSVAMPARALVLVLDGARRANATTRLSPVTRQSATRSTSLGVRSAIASTVAAASFSASSVGG
jgi:hypothetical protein